MTAPPDISRERARARRAAADAEGWLSDAQGQALFDVAARTTGRGHIVEIGSWQGRSTIWLACGARLAGQRVLAVDRHVGSRENPAATTLEAFTANIRRAGVEGVVVPLVMSSAEAAQHVQGSLEVLFIDGDHSDEGSRKDADLWLPRLMDGGVVLMHDVVTAGYSGPRRMFRRRICWSAQFASIRRVGSMAIATRVNRRRPSAAVWGWLAGLLLYLVDAKRQLRKARRRDRTTA